MINDKHTQALQEFEICLYEKRFYDAHEALEEIWFPRRFEDNNEIKLLKGFINASVCFELIKKQRLHASNKVWKNYIKYRPLLYKIDSPYLNTYHKLTRHVEKIYINKII